MIKQLQILQIEGFVNRSASKEINKIKIMNGSGISSSRNLNLPLREYCIKSSYNTALSGKYLSTDMIKYV